MAAVILEQVPPRQRYEQKRLSYHLGDARCHRAWQGVVIGLRLAERINDDPEIAVWWSPSKNCSAPPHPKAGLFSSEV